MTKKIDTFSAHSLKILDKNLQEFEDKFIYGLSLFKKDNRAILGQNFHNLICAFLFEKSLDKIVLAVV